MLYLLLFLQAMIFKSSIHFLVNLRFINDKFHFLYICNIFILVDKCRRKKGGPTIHVSCLQSTKILLVYPKYKIFSIFTLALRLVVALYIYALFLYRFRMYIGSCFFCIAPNICNYRSSKEIVRSEKER